MKIQDMKNENAIIKIWNRDWVGY